MRKLLFTLFLTWLAFSSYAQNPVIKGRVTDEKGDPLPGVTVTLKGTQQRTVTNPDGVFSLNLGTATGRTLVLTYISFQTQEVNIAGKQTVDVKMMPDSKNLSEVVVTALNIKREKASLGYAAQSVNTNDLTEARANNITDLLDGKVAGLQTTTSGQPNGSTRLLLRGTNSITGNNQPLWVVDGVPIDNTDSNGQVGNLDYGNNAADLNPDDIESIEVLKGPNAAALYGSKAANGAILITTKKGKKNAGLGISVNSNWMQSQVLQYPAYQNVYGEGSNDKQGGTLVGPLLGQQVYQAGTGGGRNWGAPLLGQPMLAYNGTPTTYSPHPNDYMNLYQKANTYTQNVSISQADDKSNIRFSYTRLDGNDVVQKQNLTTKNNFQFTAGKDFTNFLRIDARLQYVQEQVNNRTFRNESPQNPLNYFNNAVNSIPLSSLIPWKDANGNAFNGGGSGNIENPYWDINENANQDNRNTIIGGITATFKITKDLQFRAQESINDLWGNRWVFIQKGSLSQPTGSYSEFQQNNKVFNTEGLLMYNKHISDFSISANLGGNLRNTNYYNSSATVSQLLVHDVKNLSNNAGIVTGTETPLTSQVQSVYGTASVGYKNFLYVDATGRNDWSSTLAPQNSSFFYPSVSGSFVFTELFKIPQNILSFGKLRASIARVGNDPDPYNLISQFSYGNNFNGLPYVQIDQNKLKTANLKPEQTTSTEFGAELKFLNNRLSVDASVYKTKSINQILTGNTAPEIGYLSEVINAGEIDNKGFELTLSGTPIRTKNFSWDATYNFSMNRNMVVSLAPGITSFTIGSQTTVNVNAEVGKPLGVLRGKDQAYSSDGLPIIVAATGIEYQTPNQIIGNFNPRALMSFGSTFRYKQFSLNFLVNSRIGGQLFSATYWRANTAGATVASLGGRDAFLFSNGVLGETGNELAGTTTLYNLAYPDASRAKGMLVPGYYPVLGSNGQPLLDAKGNMIADLTKPNTRWVLPQTYWQQTGNDTHLLTFDATYVKLSQVIIGFSVPQTLLRRTIFKGASVSLVGRNLWFIYQRTPKGIDPEAAAFSNNTQGVEAGGSAPYASYGIDLKFTL
jgi:TonB-linked SusC/RagA family outer membrane protein